MLACTPVPGQRWYRYMSTLQLGCLRLKVLREVWEEARESLQQQCCEKTWPQHWAKLVAVTFPVSRSTSSQKTEQQQTDTPPFNLQHPLQQEESCVFQNKSPLLLLLVTGSHLVIYSINRSFLFQLKDRKLKYVEPCPADQHPKSKVKKLQPWKMSIWAFK